MNNQNLKTLDLKKCDAIKVSMMMLVIVYHAIALWLKGGWFNQPPHYPSVAIGAIASYLNTIHIYVFTFVSGYIFYYLKFEKGKYNKPLYDIGHRAKRLLVPYALASILWVIPFVVIFDGFNLKSLIKNFVFALSPSQLWFLWMIFIVFVIFTLTAKLFDKMPFILGLFVCICVYGVAYVSGSIVPNVFQILTALKFVLFFYLGFAFRKFDFKIFYRVPWLLYVIASIGLFCLNYFVLKNYDGMIFKLLRLGTLILAQVFGTLMVVVGFSKINCDKIYDKSLFKFFKKHNFNMYLTHQQIIYISITLFNGIVPNVILVLSNLAFAFVGSSLISIIIEKFKGVFKKVK